MIDPELKHDNGMLLNTHSSWKMYEVFFLIFLMESEDLVLGQTVGVREDEKVVISFWTVCFAEPFIWSMKHLSYSFFVQAFLHNLMG